MMHMIKCSTHADRKVGGMETDMIRLVCPFCGSKIRVNTKYSRDDNLNKQAQCTDYSCAAKGPMAYTTEKAKLYFGVVK
jgi:hypothetical protein